MVKSETRNGESQSLELVKRYNRTYKRQRHFNEKHHQFQAQNSKDAADYGASSSVGYRETAPFDVRCTGNSARSHLRAQKQRHKPSSLTCSRSRRSDGCCQVLLLHISTGTCSLDAMTSGEGLVATTVLMPDMAVMLRSGLHCPPHQIATDRMQITPMSSAGRPGM